MTTFVFANNVNTTLAGNVSTTATTLTLASAANLPASIPSGFVMALTLNDSATRNNYEIVYVTAITGATLTVLRAHGLSATLRIADQRLGSKHHSPRHRAITHGPGITHSTTRLLCQMRRRRAMRSTLAKQRHISLLSMVLLASHSMLSKQPRQLRLCRLANFPVNSPALLPVTDIRNTQIQTVLLGTSLSNGEA